jgi:hypothetical protein
MKRPLSCLAIAAALALAGCNKLTPTPPMQTTNEIEMDLLVVQLPQTLALPLIAELRDRTRAARAAEELLKLVAKDQATLLAWPFLATGAGQRAVAEQVDEFRYATKYDAPGTATVTETHGADPGVPDPPVVPIDPATSPPAVPVSAGTKTKVSVIEGVPTDFETRNLGVTFEVEPTLRPDGRTIDLSLVPQHVRLRGMKKVEIEEKSSGKKVVVEQPEIVNHKITTNISVQDGDYTLLGVFKLDDFPDQMELFVLHTRLKRVEAGVPPVPIVSYPPIEPAANFPLDPHPPGEP